MTLAVYSVVESGGIELIEVTWSCSFTPVITYVTTASFTTCKHIEQNIFLFTTRKLQY